MTEPRFIIIENIVHLVHARVLLLRDLGYRREHIWPLEDTQTVESWDDALNTIVSLRREGWDPTNEECYLLCDLALDEKNRTAEEGIAQLKNAHDQLRDYIVIAVTSYAGRAKSLIGNGADYVVDPSATEGRLGKYFLELALQQARQAWALRTGRVVTPAPVPYALPDSPGVRSLLAALPREVVTLLTKLECVGWTDMTISALTGGYSGAHVLLIEGTEGGPDGGAARSLVCKVARRSEMLMAEAERTKRAVESYKIYVGRIAPFVQMSPKPLGPNEAWYSVQSTVPGVTIEQILLKAPEVAARQLPQFADELSEMLDAFEQKRVRERPAISALSLTDVDVERFSTTVPSLTTLAARCNSRGLLPEAILNRVSAEDLVRLASTWNASVTAVFSETPQYEQHGDFNPRNIFIVPSGHFQLIDFGRFGLWPAGYDLVRLELQLLLRGVDRIDELDVLPDRLPRWLKLWAGVAAEAENLSKDVLSAGPDDSKCDASLLVLVQFLTVLWGHRSKLLHRLIPNSDETSQRKWLALQRAYDAIKICSYQDASAFKRLWFLNIAAESAHAAGLL